MKISEVLTAIATWLESSENEAVIAATDDDDCLATVATYCIEAADILKQAAVEVQLIEPKEPSILNEEGIDSLGSLADALESSGDPELIKQAALIDELLITISAPKNSVTNKKSAEEKKIKELADKFQNVNKELAELNSTSDIAKDIEPVIKNYKNLEAPLSTRYCPDHPGVNLYKEEDNVWVCELDKKKYDFASGFNLMDGSKVSGGDVSNQTEYHTSSNFTQFDTRESRQNK